MSEIHADAYFAMIPEWVLYADISPSAVRLYAVLRRFADKSTGMATPKRSEMATKLRASERTVIRAMRELEDIGAVTIEARYNNVGEQTSNRYLVRSIPPQEALSPPAPAHPQGDTDVTVGVSQVSHLKEPESVTQRTTPTGVVDAPVTDLSPKPVSEFEEFWKIYPRREGKRAAEKAWSKAITRDHPGHICAQALRYRDDPNREPAFTPHPATWLNRDGWHDEPLPPRHATPGPASVALGAAAVLDRWENQPLEISQ